MILFVDTETTGLPIMDVQSNGAKWYPNYMESEKHPRIVQFSFLRYDREGTMKSMHDFIVKPDNFIIPPDSTKIHNISQDQAMKNGTPMVNILDIFKSELDQVELVVMHNAQFDKNIILSEAFRYERRDVIDSIFKNNFFCTMKQTKNYVGIRSQYYDGFKNPSLTELHNKLFNERLPVMHNSLNDAKVTAKCFFRLLSKNKIRFR